MGSVGSAYWKYQGGVLLPDGHVVLVPTYADTVGLYNPGASAASKPAYTLSQPFSGHSLSLSPEPFQTATSHRQQLTTTIHFEPW